MAAVQRPSTAASALVQCLRRTLTHCHGCLDRTLILAIPTPCESFAVTSDLVSVQHAGTRFFLDGGFSELRLRRSRREALPQPQAGVAPPTVLLARPVHML